MHVCIDICFPGVGAQPQINMFRDAGVRASRFVEPEMLHGHWVAVLITHKGPVHHYHLRSQGYNSSKLFG